MTGVELDRALEDARDRVLIDSLSSEALEGLVRRFAEALVQLAATCVIGQPCEKHGGAVHGREAEELRAGLERLIKHEDPIFDSVEDMQRDLQQLLDEVDARDSLAFREATDGLDEDQADGRVDVGEQA